MLLHIPFGKHSLKMKSPGANMNPGLQEKLAMDPIMFPILSSKRPLVGAVRGGHDIPETGSIGT